MLKLEYNYWADVLVWIIIGLIVLLCLLELPEVKKDTFIEDDEARRNWDEYRIGENYDE